MPLGIDITDAGVATLSIPDAGGEFRAYRWRLVPRGLSLFALELTRADTDARYLVRELSPGRWTCDCSAFTYRKRGSPLCKHCAAARAFRAFLRTLENAHERSDGDGSREAPRRAI